MTSSHSIRPGLHFLMDLKNRELINLFIYLIHLVPHLAKTTIPLLGTLPLSKYMIL